MNGKGDRERIGNRPKFRANYDDIDWHRQPETELGRRLARQETNWWNRHFKRKQR